MDLFLAPERYIQQKGIIKRVGEFLIPFGKRPLLLADGLVFSIVGKTILESLKEAGLSSRFEEFRGECSPEEIDKVTNIIKKEGIDVVIGCGGGKSLDTAKAASLYARLPVITIPTSAATCAAWSFIAPTYTREGKYIKTLDLKKSPDLTLVDPEVISQAPARLISAGMADTLAKWYEGRVVVRNMKKDLSTELALSLSKRACELIKEFGPKAKEDVERKRCSKEVELIIQTNILLTGLIAGLGREKFRSVAAHALNYAMTMLRGNRSTLHGERVAFGIIMQLILERRNEDEIEELLELYSLLGLPLTLEEIGLRDEEKLKIVVKEIFRQGRRIRNLPFSVDEDMVYKALLKADDWGRKMRK